MLKKFIVVKYCENNVNGKVSDCRSINLTKCDSYFYIVFIGDDLKKIMLT